MNFLLMLAIPISLVLIKFFGVWGGLRYAGPRLYPNVSPNLPVAAGVRTGLGMVATGILAGLGALLTILINNPQYSSLFSGGLDVSFFFTLQLLFRAAIWLFMVVWFYDRRLEHRTEAAKLWSAASCSPTCSMCPTSSSPSLAWLGCFTTRGSADEPGVGPRKPHLLRPWAPKGC